MHCFFEVALLLKGTAKSEIGLGIGRLESDGAPMSRNRFRQPGLLLQHCPKMVVTRRIIRPQFNLLTKQPFGSCEIALLSRNDAEVAKCGSVGGINPQDRGIKALGISDRAPALRGQGVFQQMFRCRMSHSVVRSPAETLQHSLALPVVSVLD